MNPSASLTTKLLSLLAGLSATALIAAPMGARAVPVVDQDTGTWFDTFIDPSGLAADTYDPGTGPVPWASNISHSPGGQLFTLAPSATSGRFATPLVAPSSFSGWSKVYLDYSAFETSDLVVKFADASNTFYGPFALVASDDPSFDRMAVLNLPASITTGRVVVELEASTVTVDGTPTIVRPTLQALKLTWSPTSQVRVGYAASKPEPCSNEVYVYTLQAAVSLVSAPNLIAWAPLPVAAADPYGADNTLQFVSATNGGLYTATPITVAGVSIPARSVYYQLGTVRAGTTLRVSYAVRIPRGTTDDTLYLGQASAQARLGTDAFGAVSTSPTVTVKAMSAPRPSVAKRTLSAITINNLPYADPATTVTYELAVSNYLGASNGFCTETYHAAVVWDDVSDLLTGNAGGSFIEDPPGITIAPSAFPSGFTATDVVIDGVLVEGPAIYWQLGHLPVGQTQRLTYSVTLRGRAAIAEDSVIDNVAAVESAVDPELDDATHQLGVGLPRTPSGIFATGDVIRGASSITAQNNDNPTSSVSYGESYGLLLHGRNSGVSTLNRVITALKIPADTTFQSIVVPAELNATVYYSTQGAANADTSPPGFDVATGTRLPGTWTTTPPAPGQVVWIMVEIPALSSVYFPNPSGPPSSFTAEVRVGIDMPADTCPLLTVSGNGLYAFYGYTPRGESEQVETAPWSALVADAEPVQVMADKPGFALSQLSVSPDALTTAGTFTSTITVRNQQPLGAPTDSASNVVVDVTTPSLPINGVTTLLTTTIVDSGGGTVSYAQASSGLLRVTFPYIEPYGARTITLSTVVPPGYEAPSSAPIAATVRAVDPECGLVEQPLSAAVSLQGNPTLTSNKRADLSVVSAGAELTYTLGYDNVGDTTSHETWLVDQVAPELTVLSTIGAAGWGEVWFAPRGAPNLPALMDDPDFAWSEAVVLGNFTLGDEDNGAYFPPPGMDVGWVAYRLDDPDATPPSLFVDSPGAVTLTAAVSPGLDTGDVVRNRTAVFSRELLPALSNESLVTVSADPSVAITGVCGGPYFPGDSINVEFDYVNDSSNDGYATVVRFTLPSYASLAAATHTWNDVALSTPDFPAPEVVCTQVGADVTCDVGAALAGVPLGSLQGGHLTLALDLAPNTPAGSNEPVLATLETANATASFVDYGYASCAVAVELTDITVVKTIDNPRPVQGQIVTYTLDVRNAGENVAVNVSVVDTLPPGLAFVPGVTVVTPGWSLGGTGEPVLSGPDNRTLTWSDAEGNALTRDGATPGVMEAGEGPVRIVVRARVLPTVATGTTLINRVVVATDSIEVDPGLPNEDDAELRVPHPDPWVQKAGPATATPRGTIGYTLRYGNASPTATTDVLVVDRLPDLRLLSVATFSGETVYYNTSTAAVAPALDLADPAATGWTTTRPANATALAVHRAALPGNSGPYVIQVSLEVRRNNDLPPLAGEQIENCVGLGYPTGRTAQDESLTNNSGCTTAKLPGVDLALDMTCTPDGARPGILPGDPVSVEVRAVVTGTVATYGVYIDWTPPAWLVDPVVDATSVTVTDASGATISPVDLLEVPLADTVPWTRIGDRFYVGSDDPASPLYYRKVGLPPGARVSFTATGTAAPSMNDGQQATLSGTVGTDLRFDAGPTTPNEENLTNNVDACGPTVLIPDPMVAKSGSAAILPLVAGGNVDYRVEFDNTGSGTASNVVVDDVFPPGMSFVIGSVSGLPEGATLSYDDGSGSYSYVPTGAAGTPDPNVVALRVVFATMAAPMVGGFVAERQADFDRGTYNNVVVSSDGEALLVNGTGSGGSGTYTTELFPPAGETVTEWVRVVLDADLVAGSVLSVDVLDTAGALVRQGLMADAAGVVSLAGIDPVLYPRLALRVHLESDGGVVTCTYDQDTNILPAAEPSAAPSVTYQVATCLPGGKVVGSVRGQIVPSLGHAVDRPLVWEGGLAATAPTFLPMPVTDANGRVSFRWRDYLIGYVERHDANHNNGPMEPAVWRRGAAGWEIVPIASPSELAIQDSYIVAADSSAGHLVGQLANRLVVWRDLGGTFEATPLTPASRECYPVDARAGIILGFCPGDGGTYWLSPIVWRSLGNGTFTEVSLPAVASWVDEPRITSNGDVLGRSGGAPVVWTYAADSWSLSALSTPGSGAMALVPNNDRMVFVEDDLPYVVERVGGAWQVTALPLPAHIVSAEARWLGSSGLAAGYGFDVDSSGHTLLWFPTASGTWEVREPADVPAYTDFESASDLAAGRVALRYFSGEVFAFELGATQGTLDVSTTQLIGFDGGDVPRLASIVVSPDPEVDPGCAYFGVDEVDTGRPVVWTPETPSPITPQLLAAPSWPTSAMSYYSQIAFESHGVYLGYTGLDQNVPTAWRPDARGVLRQYVLPAPPDGSYADGIDLGMASLDQRFIAMSYGRTDDGRSTLGVYRYDALGDAYVFDRIPFSVAPDHLGSVSSVDDATFAWDPYPDAVRAEVDDLEARGFMLTIPGASSGFVFSHLVPWADGSPVEGWSRFSDVRFGYDGMTLFDLDDEDQTQLAIVADPAGVRDAIAVPLPADRYYYSVWSMGYNHTVAAEMVPGEPVSILQYVDMPTPDFRSLPIPGVPASTTVYVAKLGRTAFPGTDYPAAVVFDDEAPWRLFNPDANGVYSEVDLAAVATASGFDNFTAFNRWPKPMRYDYDLTDRTGFEATSILGGTVGVLQPGDDPISRPGFIVFQGGAWQAVALPLPAELGGAIPEVRFATEGPVIYGRAETDNGLMLVAWHFPTGDLTAPVAVTATGYDYVDYSCCLGYAHFAATASTSERGPIVALRGPDSTTTGFGFFVPRKSPAGHITTLSAVRAASLDNRFDASDFTTHMSVTSPVIPWFDNTTAPNGRVNQWGCAEPLGAIDTVRATYRGSENPGFDYSLVLPDTCQASITNTATITSSTAQITDANDSASVELPVATVDLAVDLAVDRGTVTVGQSLTYLATVTNHGPSPAHDLVVTVTIPDLTTADATVTSTWDLCVDFGVCELAAGASFTLDPIVTAPSTFDESFIQLTANATVTSSDITCNGDDDTSSATTLTGALPNVEVRKTGPANIALGQPATYTITYRNNGNADATTVVVTDTPPPGLTLVPSGAELTWTDGTLPPSDTPTAKTVTLLADDCSMIGREFTNTVAVTADFDVMEADNTDAATTVIEPPLGELELVASPTRSEVRPGERLTYVLRYRNAGTAPVTGAQLYGAIPTGTTLVPGASTPGSTQVGSELRWALPSPLPAGASGSVELTVTANGAVGTALTGAARVDVGAPSVSNACDVTAPYAASTLEAPGLRLTKQASAATTCGGTVSWVLTVVNDGATAEAGLVVTDALPTGAAYVAGSIAGPGASDAAAPVLVWSLPTLAPGEAITLGYRTAAPANGVTITNVAELERANTTLATSAPTTVIGACAAPRLAKSMTAVCSEAADTLEVALTYTNGSTGLSGVTLTDALAPGFTFVSADAGLTYDAPSHTLTANLGALAPNASGTLRFRVAIAAPNATLLANTATLTSSEGFTTTSNEVTTVVQSCDDGDPCTADSCAAFTGCTHTLTPAPEQPELCDGLDNDCDGLADADDPGLVPEPCLLTAGVCSGTLSIECVAGEWAACTTTDYVAQTGGLFEPTDATCDNVDNDCDGVRDEGFSGEGSTNCGVGVCATTGTSVCVDGQVVDSCTPLAPLSTTDSECDGLDADCDGLTDEDFVGTAITCLPSSCTNTATGTTACVAGQITDGGCDPAYALAASDPAYQSATGPSCDGLAAGGLRVSYAVLYDAANRPVGSIRCTLDPATGAVACDVDEATNQLTVLDGAFCPAP